MAVGSCPECNGKLSSEAETCPHCGFRRNANSKSGKSLELSGWQMVVLVVAIILGFLTVISIVVWRGMK